MKGSPKQQGVTLIESMISLLILCVGILGLAQFQVGMLAQTTAAQQRLAASSLTEELLSQVRVDLTNVACYTLPQTGACGSPYATAQSTAWAAKVPASLPGFTSATVQLVDANQISVVLTWTSKSSSEVRRNEVRTDVRP